MGFSKNLNGKKRETLPEGIKLDELDYVHIKNLIGKKKTFPIPVKGFFISKGKFGLGVVLIAEIGDELKGLNIPSWYVDRFKEASDEDVAQILDGRLMITSAEEVSTKNGTTYQLEFEDVD